MFTDARGRRTYYTRDDIGRVLTETRPDSVVTRTNWTAEGELRLLTPPGQPSHELSYNSFDLLESYDPPAIGAAGSTTYHYNLDKQLDWVVQPSASSPLPVVDYVYDNSGRLSTINYLSGQTVYGYDPSTGRLTTMSGPGNLVVTSTYDGPLLETTTWTGDIQGSIARTPDASFRLGTETINGGWSTTYGYDNDDLLTSAGALTITRHPASGQVEATTAGLAQDAYGYSEYGELRSHVASFDGSRMLAWEYTRDELGRIRTLSESDGTIDEREFEYDDAGRLITVKIGSTILEQYTYDDNGNRLTALNASGAFTAQYDDQDRLETYGDLAFNYTSNGELEFKENTATQELTSYWYL